MSRPRAAVYALLLLALVLAGGTWALSGEANLVTSRDLLEAPDKWHGRPLVLSGTVTRLEPQVLRDPGGQNGQRVQVEGIFHKVKRVGKHTFQNQVDATRIHPR